MRRAIPAVTAAAAGLLAMALATGWGLQQLAPGATEDAESARAVAALTRDPGPLPAPSSTATSACSSPFGATAYDFEAACRRHDRGYALLRVAADRGRPLGGWARTAIDDRFRRDLAGRCAALGPDDRQACGVAAEGYADAVAINSWRQGYGVPVAEG